MKFTERVIVNNMKNILILNDISGLGNCSMAANLPIFTKLGHYCMPVVSASYSCQTGFSNFSVLPNDRVVEFARDITDNCSPDAFYVGFCNNVATLQAVERITSDVLPSGVYLFVDPIMGDNGKLYPVFDDAYVTAMKVVVRGAKCITPNLTEACLLADVDYRQLTSQHNDDDFLSVCGEAFKDFTAKTGVCSAVITGVKCGKLIGNIVLDGKVSYVTNERADVDYSGTGDVFSSVLLGELLNGVPLVEATTVAANFVGKAAQLTRRADRRYGIDFCKLLGELK